MDSFLKILRYNNIVKKLNQLFLIMNAKRACETFYTHTQLSVSQRFGRVLTLVRSKLLLLLVVVVVI